jgi:excisionase family DNA binding protein
MAQAYYTLDEAAQMLGMPADELKQMARKGQIRSFQDRGTWRFRVQDIQELARQRGAGSEPELPLSKPAAPAEPAGPRSPVSKSRDPEVFDFSLDLDEEHVGIGHEDLRGGSPSKKKSGLSPAPKAGSDSDVRLVTDSELEALAKKKKGSDSEVKLVHQDAPSSRTRPGSGPKSSKINLSGPRSSKPGSSRSSLSPRPGQPGSGRKSGVPSDPVDSGVRLVPLDSDSDVKIVGASADDIALGQQPPLSATDSDIRLQQSGRMIRPESSVEGSHTDEIDLDQELQQAAGAGQQPGKLKPKSGPPALPQSSPFELSDPDVQLPDAPASDDLSSDSSGDFELTPAAESSSPLTSSSDEFTLELPDDADIGLGELPPSDKTDPASGINLVNPADGGISLEESSSADEVDFELGAGQVQHTPRPASSPSHRDSEFELSLDADSEAPPSDSSEFELTLDDSGGLAPLEEDAGDKDIFETDFEVPALEDESGSQAVAEEGAELESSDFDLTLGGEDDVVVEEESGSQVVALDEDVEESALGEEEPAFDQFETEEGAEVEEEEAPVVQKALPTAPWGALPVVIMLPCVIVLFLVGIMGFELVQSVAAHKPPGTLTKALSGLLGQNPKQ